MQTFLPYKSFEKSAKVLDSKRLGNQRNEAMILLKSNVYGNGWSKHPASKMWYKYEEALKLYINIVIGVWEAYGNENNWPQFIINWSNLVYPPWLGKRKFHSSHRSALLYKNYKYYSKFSWKEEPTINYYWPRKYFLR